MSRTAYAIAIVGIGCTYPGAPGPDAFWDQIYGRRCVAAEPPEGRWSLPVDALYDPEPGKTDKLFSRKACFVEETVHNLSEEKLPLPSGLLEKLDPAFHLLLDAGLQVWRDGKTERLDRSRVGLVLGNLALPSDSSSALARENLGRQVEKMALGKAPTGSFFNSRTDPLNRYVAGLPAGILTQALQITGGHFTLDAACASSLYALKLACDRLIDGTADAMLAGGLSRPDGLFTQMGFSQLRALSPSGTCSPFDADGNGLVVGEGAGLVLLKRLEDAQAQGDRIYGVIRGAGLSNDIGGSLLAPMSDGQVRAMRQAYDQAGWKPSEVDLIECHATGTPVGDAVEFNSLQQLWSEEDWRSAQCVLGSVKSNIGHLLTAAGSAALIKILLALKNGSLPPTSNFHRPPKDIALAQSPFRILQQPEPWVARRPGRPRRAGISAFGFGGINAHILVEEYISNHNPTETPQLALNLSAPEKEPIAVVAVKTTSDPEPISSLELTSGRFRIPPREMEEMLPQQLLMLQTAADALEQAGIAAADRERAGVFIGIAFDLAASGFNTRWTLPMAMASWPESLSEEQRQQVIDTAHPPLTANRVMGALGNIVASRIAREFRFGGPSYTLSSEGTSGIHALATAVSALQGEELDLALVGAVDLPHTPWLQDRSVDIPEGTCCLVLKRLSDATQAKDQVLGLIEGVKLSSSGAIATIGDAISPSHAASGLQEVARGIEQLSQRQAPYQEDLGYWLINRNQGGRSLNLELTSLDGNRAQVSLKEPVPPLSAKQLVPIATEELPFLLQGDDPGALIQQLQQLGNQLQSHPALSLAQQALLWHQSHKEKPGKSYRAALVTSSPDQLQQQLPYLQQHLTHEPEIPLGGRERLQPDFARDQVFYSGEGASLQGETALVFPGMGNPYEGMGRRLSTLFPQVFSQQEKENKRLRDQYQTDTFWQTDRLDRTDQNALVIGQVAYGTAVADSLALCGIRPQASIGYSLGESTALFALRAWPDRDGMLQRLEKSPLFVTELAGPVKAAVKRWKLDPDTKVDWVSGVLACPADRVKQALKRKRKAYLLIVNTPEECVIGGDRQVVNQIVKTLDCPFFPLEGVSAVHCDVVKAVEKPYRDLHSFKTTPPDGTRFYSGATGRAYRPTRDLAADAILNQALSTVDFTRVIRQAYKDGVRFFVEAGPGNSCSRMIPAILGDQPYFSRSVSQPALPEDAGFVRLLTQLNVMGSVVDIAPLLQGTELPDTTLKATHRIPRWKKPAIPLLTKTPGPETAATAEAVNPSVQPTSVTMPPNTPVSPVASSPDPSTGVAAELTGTASMVLQAANDRAVAHETFLRVMDNLQSSMQQQLQLQQQLIQAALTGQPIPQVNPVVLNTAPAEMPPTPTVSSQRSVLFNREQCFEFAVGSVARMLGPEFAEVDSYPTRVRLPDEPLQLVDRILEIDGVPRSMQPGRVVTEHDVLPGVWYLDGNRAPTCISVEAGQADLFLSGYLGIDFQHKGQAVYRLLDAVVTFHRDLPQPGETILYDIHIDHFFRQGDTWLFRFWFDGTINGKPFITMRKGCAGFFSEEELNAGKGIVHTRLDLMEQPGKKPDGWKPLVPIGIESYTDSQVDALRNGDLASCYGSAFRDLPLKHPLTLPGGRMKLVDRILELNPEGGRFGLGQIRGEADIHPDDWFLTCHFCDDHVMPGTLMYECCQHTMRILLMRMGWLAETEGAVWQPVPEIGNQLKCRGQVIESTQKVEYRITLKEVGYRPEPYAIADALMLADGKPIVEVINLSVMLTGTDQSSLEQMWASKQPTGIPVKVPIFDTDRITAFAVGKPSEAFGDRYRVFDEERRIARLPGPPFQFLDRITEIQATPWELKAGGVIEAQYDVPADAWYFGANRQPEMPFCVLLETALQPCGWLAAYLGSALTSDKDLAFRNLDGSAVQLKPVTPESGTLTTKVKITSVSQSGGMIIQSFDYEMVDAEGPVYRGDTVFGFFTRDALANQIGLRDIEPFRIDDPARKQGKTFNYPAQGPFPETKMRMINRISCYLPDGGDAGLGYIEGEMDVDPSAWFFKAHFYQDPVVPGSLGLESMLQCLKVVAADRWDVGPDTIFETIALQQKHQWSYRGQVVPDNSRVRVEAMITAVNDDYRMLTADGYLHVDGKTIYRMNDFTLKLK